MSKVTNGLYSTVDKIIRNCNGTFLRNCKKSFVLSNDIDIAVLTIPKESAVTVADELVNCGIKAIWNFAHVDLNVPEGIVVENVHLSESLMKLSYDLNSQGNKH